MPNVINYGNPVPLRTPHRRNVEAFTNALNKNTSSKVNFCKFIIQI